MNEVSKKFIEKFLEIGKALDAKAFDAAVQYADSDDVMYREKYLAFISARKQLDIFGQDLEAWCKEIEKTSTIEIAVKTLELARRSKYIGVVPDWGRVEEGLKVLREEIKSGTVVL